MRSFLLSLSFLLLVTNIEAQLNENGDKFLVVDPKGHNALVNEIMYSSLTRELISVSDDKTIRLWDDTDQVLNRTFRIKSKPSGPDGMIYAATLSKDGRYLAVAGYSFYNDIKVIDLQRGDIVVVLSGHKNVVTGLDFSPDGKYLASSSADEGIIIWEKGAQYLYEKKYSLYQHQRRVNDLQFSPDGNYLVSASDDETIRVWDPKGFATNQDPAVYQNHLGPIKRVACGALGFLSGGEDGIVNFWGWNGELKSQIVQFGSPVTTLEVSDFGDYAFLSGDRQIAVNLRNPSSKIQLFQTNQNVSAAYFSEDNKLFLGQGRSGNIIAYDLVKREPVYAYRGQGRDLKALVINGDKLGVVPEGASKPDAYYDFSKSQIVRDAAKMEGFAPAVVSDGNFSFQVLNNNQLLLGTSFSISNSSRDGRVLSYTLLANGNVAVGSDRTLKVYSLSGELLKELEGHNGQVLSVVSNNNYLFSYGGDQIVKVWSLADFSLVYNLFITRGFDWILWNKEGVYTASAGGERFLNWQINKAENLLSEHFDVSTFGDTFLKESLDEVPIIATRDQDSAIAVVLPEKPEIKWTYPSEYQTEVADTKVRIQATIFSDKPILKTRILVSGQPLPSKRGITDLKQIDEHIDLTAYKTTVEIFASTEDSKIVSEKRVFINPNLSEVTSGGITIIDPDKKPNLFFLGIGVSEFVNPEFNLTYADDDAKSIYDIFASGSSKIYNKFDGTTLLNQEATKSNILTTLSELSTKVQPKDMVVLFIASHGINEDGYYYVLTHDADKQNLTTTCVRWDELAEAIGALPCRVLLLLDTCHSGALGTNLASSEKYLKNTEALRSMGSVEVGVVIMSGSTGEESSLESADWEHGVFTLSLIKGLKEMQADLKADGLIYLRELDFYVSNNVNELTQGKQNPTTQKPSTVSKFLIY